MSQTIVVIESITPNVSVEIAKEQGPQGPPGLTGATGAQGDPGPTGATGPANGTATPLALGTAAAGTASASSHEDHVHPTTGLATSGANSNITSLTGLTTPLSAGQGGTGLSALGTGVATALGVNVGTAGSPVVNGGALGTPSSGTLTNATGLPVSTGVSGLAANMATFLATPSSANLLATMTSDTGTGNLVFGTGPTISQPIIDNAKLGYTTTASSGTAIVLTASSNYQQYVTGSTAQTITLPVASTMTLGQSFKIVNNNTANSLTVNSSGGNTVITIPVGFNAEVVCILTSGTSAASWSASFCDFDTVTGTGSVVLGTSPSIATPALTGTVTSSGDIVNTGGQSYVIQQTPFNSNTGVTLTIANLLTNIVTGTPTAAISHTLPTGTLMDGGDNASNANNGSFDWWVINLSSTAGATITILAGTAHTVVGNMVVPISASAYFRSRKTASNTWITYRLA